jgi:hypothetical protein
MKRRILTLFRQYSLDSQPVKAWGQTLRYETLSFNTTHVSTHQCKSCLLALMGTGNRTPCCLDTLRTRRNHLDGLHPPSKPKFSPGSLLQYLDVRELERILSWSRAGIFSWKHGCADGVCRLPWDQLIVRSIRERASWCTCCTLELEMKAVPMTDPPAAWTAYPSTTLGSLLRWFPHPCS